MMVDATHTGWNKAKLGDVATIDRAGVSPENISSGTTYVGLDNIASGGTFINVGKVSNGELASTKFAFSSQHILYGKLRPYLAKISCPDFDGVCSTDILPILPGPKLDKRFLCYFLLQPHMVDFATSRCTGANLPRLSPTKLAEFQIPLPPLAEQKRIADILDKADAVRRKRREVIDHIHELRRSELMDFTGDAVVAHVTPKLHGTEQFLPEGFRWRKLEEVCEEICDIDHKMPKAVDTGIPFISPKDMPDDEELNFENVKCISEEDFLRLSRKIKPRRNDIIYSRIGARLGKARIVRVDFDFLASYSCCTIRVKELLADPLYLTHYLDSIITRRQANLDTQSIAVPDLGLAKIKAFLVPIPSLKIQQGFAIRITKTDELLGQSRSSFQEAEDLFNSLVQRAFKGEL